MSVGAFGAFEKGIALALRLGWGERSISDGSAGRTTIIGRAVKKSG